MLQDTEKTYYTPQESKKLLSEWLQEDAKDLRKTLQAIKTENYECNV